jgi:hypothetical protein
VWLGAIVMLSFLLRLLLALRDPAPWIFNDEITYSELAKSIAYAGHFAIRGEDGTGGFGVLYPITISPAYALFGDVPRAYDAVRVLNALYMSLTVVPVFFLARRLASRSLALLAAGLAVLVPSVAYSANVMTESVFYPLFATWLLALYLALERPSWQRQLLALGLIAPAYLTRAQGITLLPALLGAFVLASLLDALAGTDGRFVHRLGKNLWAYRLTGGLVVGGAVAAVILQHARGKTLTDLLGAYGGVTQFRRDPSVVADWVLYHAGHIDFVVGVIPFAASIVLLLAALGPLRHDRPVRLFAAMTLTVVPVFLYVVAVYAADPAGQRILERNLFYVAPLFFVGLAAWLDRGLPRPWWAAVPAAALAALLPATIPLDRFVNTDATHSTMAYLQLLRFEERGLAIGTIETIVALGCLAAALLFLLVPRTVGLVVIPVVLLLYFAQHTRSIEGYTHKASSDALFGLRVDHDWLDDTVGRDADVGTLFYSGNPIYVWENEFFNRNVDTAYSLSGRFDGLPVHAVGAQPSGLLLDEEARPQHVAYVLVSRSLVVRGRRVAADPRAATVLYHTRGPLALDALVDGLYPDTWSGPSVRYLRYDCKPGVLTARLTNDRSPPVPVTVTATIGGRALAHTVVPPGAVRHSLQVSLPKVSGACEVYFAVSPTQVPAETVGNGDTRELGIRFTSIRYSRERS